MAQRNQRLRAGLLPDSLSAARECGGKGAAEQLVRTPAAGQERERAQQARACAARAIHGWLQRAGAATAVREESWA
ncbi:hypothetical protein HaLaN_20552 [Haematococcus lacustris]|uniref:Uncharacterized protein n=1 Tax=Haematococcus lacustris TaxID=44745 RepID=A0A699ZJQ7_HAELA|nr:hypothetical protein HaLaN_20552 [Haematococcus lacustris]